MLVPISVEWGSWPPCTMNDVALSSAIEGDRVDVTACPDLVERIDAFSRLARLTPQVSPAQPSAAAGRS